MRAVSSASLRRFWTLLTGEMKWLLRQPSLHGAVSLYIGIASGLSLLLYAIGYLSSSNALMVNSGIGDAIFYLLAVMQVLLSSAAPPVLNLLNAGHHPRAALGWLRQAAFSPAQIVVARWLAICAFMGVLVASLLPLFSLAFLMGSIPARALLVVGGVALGSTLFFTALSIAAWVSLNSRLAALAVTLGVAMALVFLWPLSWSVTSVPLDAALPPQVSGLITMIVASFSPLMSAAISLAAQSSASAGWRALLLAPIPLPWPSPFLVYLALSVLGSIALLWLAARQLKRGDDSATPMG